MPVMDKPRATPAVVPGAFPGSLRGPAVLMAAVLILTSACGGGGGGGARDAADMGDATKNPVGGGGGGGGGGSRPPEPWQWGLGKTRAYQAYARLADKEGSGVQPGGEAAVIGMLDTGIDQMHELLAGKTITEERRDGAKDENGKRFSHGTAVASVIVGARPSHSADRAHGVAWGGKLAVFAIPLETASDAPYNPVSLTGLTNNDAGDAAVYQYVLDWRNADGEPLDFLNLSFGYQGPIDSYSAAQLENNYGTTIDVLKQSDRASSNLDKTILVWAAGNAHGRNCTGGSYCVNGKVVASSPEILPGLVVRIGDLQGHSIAVAALGRDGTIADFSNRCGSAANWCITAPGEEVRVAYFGPHPDDRKKPEDERRVVRRVGTGGGTSYAAPMVTGGLAVMKHLFRDQLFNTALVERLFTTADRSGRYADTSIYGQGVMDLGAATAPVGTTQIALDGRVGGTARPLQETRLDAGGALGDGFARAFGGREIAAFDTLGAPFWFDFGDFAPVPDALQMTERLHDFMAPAPDPHPLGARPFAFPHRSQPGIAEPGASRLEFGFLATPAGAGGGHLGLAEGAMTLSLTGRDGLAFTAFSTLGIDGPDPALGGALWWRPTGANLGLRAGWLAEREAVLGTSAEGAFGRLTAHAAFAGLEQEAEVGGWRIAGGTELGVVSPRPHAGLFTDLSPLTTSAFALTATRPFDDATSLRLSVSQPLRVESGRATLSIPVGRTKGGDVLRRAVTADLAPTGRQIDVEARWHRRTASGGDLRLGAVWTRQPGHRADADPGLALLAGWRRAF